MNAAIKYLRKLELYAAGALIFAFLGANANANAAQARTTINIWRGVAPGSEHWSWKEKVERDVTYQGKNLGTIVENVVTPTLTLYLPKRSKGVGTGVIVAPGGACIALSMKAPVELASFLQSKGIAAFVLKYRIPKKTYSGSPPANLNEDLACRWAIPDAVQALKVVREHAAQWGLSPQRIGMIGFSAGAMLASEVLTQKNSALRPDFVGLIYGAPFASMPAIPARLPSNFKLASPPLAPVFMAWAQDDDTAGYAMRRFYALLVAEGYQPEAHIYHAGGHGFAMFKQSTTSGHWRQELYWWLEAEGFAKPSDGK